MAAAVLSLERAGSCCRTQCSCKAPRDIMVARAKAEASLLGTARELSWNSTSFIAVRNLHSRRQTRLCLFAIGVDLRSELSIRKVSLIWQEVDAMRELAPPTEHRKFGEPRGSNGARLSAYISSKFRIGAKDSEKASVSSSVASVADGEEIKCFRCRSSSYRHTTPYPHRSFGEIREASQ
jgi:hypothetical protein